jgi:hypothetical protein
VVVSGPQPYVEVTVAAVRSLLTEEQIAAYKAGDVSPAVVVFAAAEPQQWGSTEQPQWSEGPAQEGHKRLLVPMAKVGLVIGRGGETIKALQYQSGAHIQVLKMSDLAPNSQERPIDINGTPECIANAEELIMAAINQQSYGEIQVGGGVLRGEVVSETGRGSSERSEARRGKRLPPHTRLTGVLIFDYAITYASFLHCHQSTLTLSDVCRGEAAAGAATSHPLDTHQLGHTPLRAGWVTLRGLTSGCVWALRSKGRRVWPAARPAAWTRSACRRTKSAR